MHVSRRSVAVAIAVVAIGIEVVRPARTNPAAGLRDARLTETEVNAICAWTGGQ
jgi:hypothetical protein